MPSGGMAWRNANRDQRPACRSADRRRSRALTRLLRSGESLGDRAFLCEHPVELCGPTRSRDVRGCDVCTDVCATESCCPVG